MVATVTPGCAEANAASASVSFVMDRSKEARLAAKYALWLGWMALRDAAIFFATAGMVFGSYQR